MQRVYLVFTLFIALLHAGCVSFEPPPDVAAKADYGERPTPKQARQIVDAYIRATFKDPYSVRDLQIGEPQKFSAFKGVIRGGYFFGYTLTFSCNAKNSYGAYVGNRQTTLLIKNGRVVAVPGEGLFVVPD